MPGVKVLRIVLVAVAVLVVVAVASTQYLFAREAVPEESSYVLDRAALADAARSLDGPLPLRVNHHVVALASLPRGAVFAGESMDPHRMVHGVYQVVYDHGHVLIDAGFSRDYFEAALASEGSQYDDAAFERVARALEAAQVVVLTHEHADHIEGLGEAAAPERLARHVVMNTTQHASEGVREVLPEAFLAAVESVALDGPRAIAPGVVLVPAAGHTAGSQLVYVLTRDGRELLFVGDVAWHMDALRDLHYRPRLITDFVLDEDRAAVLAQFRTLHELLDEPDLQIVVSHDAEQRRDLVREGVLGDGIE